jgi:hypothetical protein
MTLDNILGGGGTKFPIILSDNQNHEIEGTGSLMISFEQIKLEYHFS